jgi:predicted nucleotidyltransferase component of viral defense system
MCPRFVRFGLRSVHPVREEDKTDEDGVQVNGYPEAVLERDYCLAWFLAGLSKSPLCDIFAFKGDTALKRCYIGDYRFSEDLDFTLTKTTPLEAIINELENIFVDVKKASGIIIRYSRADRKSHQNSHTSPLLTKARYQALRLKR